MKLLQIVKVNGCVKAWSAEEIAVILEESSKDAVTSVTSWWNGEVNCETRCVHEYCERLVKDVKNWTKGCNCEESCCKPIATRRMIAVAQDYCVVLQDWLCLLWNEKLVYLL